jgi:hypothetical protein
VFVLLTQVKQYLHRKKNLLHILSSNTENMASGTYHLQRNVTFLAASSESKAFAGRIQENSSPGFKSFIKDILDRQSYTINAGATGTFQGTVLLFTWSWNVKIFDLKQKKVLTKFHHAEDYIFFKQTYNAVPAVFPTPTVYAFNDSQLSYIEEMVDFIPYQSWDMKMVDTAISRIFEIYHLFFISNEKRIVDLSNHLDENLINTYNFTRTLYEELTVKQVSIYTQHGDLWFDNLLVNSERIYLVDWEYYGDHFFFSDILNVFFAEALIRGDDTYMKQFMQGEFDEKLAELFISAGEVYDPRFKKELLSLYILERFCKKDHSKTETEKRAMLARYEDTLNRCCLK